MSTASLRENSCPFSRPVSVPLPVFPVSSPPICSGPLLFFFFFFFCSGTLLSVVTSHLKFLLLLVTNFSHQCSTYTQTLLMKIKNRNKNHTSGFYPTSSSYSPSPLLSHASRKVCMDILSLCPYFPFIYPGCFSLPSLQVLPRSPLTLSHLLGPFGIIWRWWPLLPLPLFPWLPWHHVLLAFRPGSLQSP